jgi:hypothetical protein
MLPVVLPAENDKTALIEFIENTMHNFIVIFMQKDLLEYHVDTVIYYLQKCKEHEKLCKKYNKIYDELNDFGEVLETFTANVTIILDNQPPVKSYNELQKEWESLRSKGIKLYEKYYGQKFSDVK